MRLLIVAMMILTTLTVFAKSEKEASKQPTPVAIEASEHTQNTISIEEQLEANQPR